jgi:hypothetical protein
MKRKIDLTTDKALLFSAIMLILFTITMIVIFCNVGEVPDSLVVAFFGAFGLEGGYCAFIHKIKKDAQKKPEDVEEEIYTNAIGFHVESSDEDDE